VNEPDDTLVYNPFTDTHERPSRMKPVVEDHNLHGVGSESHEVYDMPGNGWGAITSYSDAMVGCPVKGCSQFLVWYEAGYVSGYRVCMAQIEGEPDLFDRETLRHRFHLRGPGWRLVRDECCEEDDA
jgi:hypothetical protein